MPQTLLFAFRELWANRTRSILTALGIIIGVLAVTLIFASGEIAQKYLSSQLLNSVGDTRLISINIFGGGLDRPIMTMDDYNFMQTLEEVLPVSKALPVYTYSSSVINKDSDTVAQTVIGTRPEITNILSDRFKNFSGRFFTDSEAESGQFVAVVSRDFSRNVRGSSTLIGENIQLGGQTFNVIGEYDAKATLFGSSEEIIAPLGAVWKIDNSPEKLLNEIDLIVNKESQIDFVQKELDLSLNGYRKAQKTGQKADPVFVRTAKQLLDTVSGILTAFQVFLGLVAFISLLVGGIGVLNVMLMSVSQRVREIGVRRALGANNWDIISIFLIESVTLTTISGLMGAGLAQYFVFLGVDIVNSINSGFGLTVQYSWSALYYATLLSAILGIIFGLYPAIRASRLSIVEALRYD